MEALAGLIVGIISFFGGIGNDAGQFASAANSSGDSKSVELGISELSPRGETGGYAMPASSDSDGEEVVITCSATFADDPIDEGSDTDVTIELSWQNSQQLNTEEVTLYRCAGGLVNNCRDNPRVLCSGTSCPRNYTVSAQASGLSSGDYTYEAVYENSDFGYGADNPVVTCSNVLDIIPDQPPEVYVSACDRGGGNCWQSQKNIAEDDEVEIVWTSAFADSCSRTAGPSDFGVNDTSGTDDSVSEPSPGSDSVFEVECSNTHGSARDSVTVRGLYRCVDGDDNDDDGLVDADDPGCHTDGDPNDGDDTFDDTDNDESDLALEPDLVPSNLGHSGTLQEGNTIDLSAQFENNGSADTGSFSNNFSYCWGSGCTNFNDNNITPYHAHANMTPSDPVGTDNDTLDLTQGGTLRLQYCVDSNLEVDEGSTGEDNNCIQTADISVASSPAPTVTIEACDLDGTNCSSGTKTIDDGDEVEITWNSTNADDGCSAIAGTGFQTGGATNGTDDDVTEPDPGASDTFTVSCQGPGGTTAESVTVSKNTIQPTLTTDCPSLVEIGDQCDFTYNDGGNTNCVLEGPNAGQSVSGSGTVEDIEIQGESTFQLVCDADSSDPVTIRVFPAGGET